jgi:hypothetical protein
MKEKEDKSLWDKIKETADVIIEPGTSAISQIFLEGALAAIVPGYTTLVFKYKQKRMEENLIRFISELQERVDIIEENFNRMSEPNRTLIKEHFAGLLCDYVIDEQQVEKIKYIANGFVTLTGQEKLDFDQTILYLDLLKSMRLIDIRILFEYENYYFGDKFKEYLESLGLDHDGYKLIKDKLLRVGLLKSSYDDEYQKLVKNVNELIEFSVSIEKGKPKRLPSTINNFKPKDRENINVSKLGNGFIEFFTFSNESSV